MERHDVERALLDEAGRETLARRASYLRERYGDRGHTGGEPGDALRKASAEEFDLNPPTREEHAANDEDFEIRTGASLELSRYVEGLEDADPKKALRFLSRKAEASPDTHFVLADAALNRLIARQRDDDEDTIEETIAALTELDQPSSESREEEEADR